ncbi:MAG: cupin domain-containing protein, partial [Patescibacteria group bacterium]
QDQFIRIEAGEGRAELDDVAHDLADDSVVIIPAGTKHNIVNTGEEPLKLYSIYATPHHKDNVIHKTKADAEKDEDEEFLGDTTE